MATRVVLEYKKSVSSLNLGCDETDFLFLGYTDLPI